MSFCVVSLSSSDEMDKLSTVTWPRFKAYADKHGFETLFYSSHDVDHQSLKDGLIYESLMHSDRVLYLEPWLVMRFDCPNVFDVIDEKSIGLFDASEMYPERRAKDARLYNLDVIVCSKEHLEFFKNNDPRYSPIQQLPHRFNRLPRVSEMTGENIADSYLVNLNGQKLKVAEKLAKGFDRLEREGIPSMPRRLNFDAPGSLGDCVAMEPLVRYIADYVASDCVLTVRTAFPDIFAHMSYRGNFFKLIREDQEFDPGFLISPMRQIPGVSFNMMHPLDFGSLNSFGGIIPQKHRRIMLTKDTPYRSDVRNHVLIHPGATWQSRTLPAWFWNKVIKGLLAEGIPVAIIGKTYGDGMRGVVPGVTRSGCLDLVDKLNLNELISAIRDSAMLISNDSSPVHISGAFNNPTIMITSVKPPEFIWPKRPSPLNVSMGRPIDSASPRIGLVNSTRLDICSDSELEAILPEPSIIVSKVKDYFLRR